VESIGHRKNVGRRTPGLGGNRHGCRVRERGGGKGGVKAEAICGTGEDTQRLTATDTHNIHTRINPTPVTGPLNSVSDARTARIL